MDKLRAMIFFCRSVESRSFAAAAKSLDVVPSALSKAVAGLEQELGFKLMNRSTRRLSLTDEGTAYYEHCRKLLQELAEVEERGREGRVRPKGTLRVGVHPAFRHAVMTGISKILDEYPDLKVETSITNSPSAVLDNGLDVVIHIGALGDSDLVARRLGSVRPVTCASPHYLSVWGNLAHPAELTQHRAAIYGRHDEDPNAEWRFIRGTERLVVQVPVQMVSRDGIGLVEAVCGGCGIARPFDVAIGPQLAAGQLIPLLQDWTCESQPVYALMPRHGSGVPAKVRAYFDFFGGILENAPR